MAFRIKPRFGIRLKNKQILIATLLSGIGLLAFFSMFLYLNTGITKEAKATSDETIATGSFIINMGLAPQTASNSLKPYGMIYEMNNTYNIPVKWVISQTKIKDGTDFTHNSINYRGGTYIIPAAFITPTIASRISYWISQGVVGNYSVSDITVPVYMDITTFPRVMIDNLSGNDTIITNYFNNAMIPASSYEINSPANLNACHDIWINPHGDPTWATHQYLYNFVAVQKSYIWMQCHAVSMMEACTEPVAPFTQLNYLSTNGLQCYMAGKCGAISEIHGKPIPGAFTHFYPNDPVMQFIGSAQIIASNGSEKWFIPLTTGGWRPTTKRLITTGSSPSPREGIIMAYGPAFGDTTNGLVMYTGGHDMNETTAAGFVAGQRSFFNFLWLAGRHKSPSLQADIAGNMNANSTDTFSVTVTGGQAPYTYQWSSNTGGTFSNPNGPVTVYNSFHTTVFTSTVVTCVITDACGRRNFFSQQLTINPSPLPVALLDFSAKYKSTGIVSLNWKTATEINNYYFSIAKSQDGKNFSNWRSIPGKGNSNIEVQYAVEDKEPLPGTSYYRLSQTDFDGTYTQLKTVTVQVPVTGGKNNKISASPNPFIDRLTIKYFSESDGKGYARIWNTNGRMVHEQAITFNSGWNHAEINLQDDLTSGIYVLRTINGTMVSDAVNIIRK